MPIEVEGDEEKRATKVVQEMLVQLRDIQAVLSTMSRRIRAPKIGAKLGDISPAIYQNGCLSAQDALTVLPAEMQHIIWSYLTYPADRLMLALTCKSHAAVFEELKGSSTQRLARTKKPATATASSSTRSGPVVKKNPTKLDRLHVLIRLEPWMPKHYKICVECLRFRPRNRTKRKTTSASSGKEVWSPFPVKPIQSDNEKDVNKVLKQNLKSGPRCPDCNERAHLDTVAAKREHKELKRELARLT